MLKSIALAGLTVGLMTVPAQAAKVVKTTIVNPPGPGFVVKKTVVDVVAVPVHRPLRAVVVNPPGPRKTVVRRVVVTRR